MSRQCQDVVERVATALRLLDRHPDEGSMAFRATIRAVLLGPTASNEVGGGTVQASSADRSLS